MIDVPTDLRCEISGLQWLDLPQLKARYADLLQDGQKCERVELRRSVIAYRHTASTATLTTWKMLRSKVCRVL